MLKINFIIIIKEGTAFDIELEKNLLNFLHLESPLMVCCESIHFLLLWLQSRSDSDSRYDIVWNNKLIHRLNMNV